MTTNAPPWFRFYNETISDLKIQRVADLSDQQKALVIGVWAAILAMASESPERGQLLISEGMPLTLREIMRHAGVDTEPGKAIMAALIEVGMIYLDGDTYTVTNWDKRQFASDSSKERVKQFRERQKRETIEPGNEPEPLPAAQPESNGAGNVTLSESDDYVKRYSNVTVTVQESDTESDTSNEVTEKSVNGTAHKTKKSRIVDKNPPTADDLLQADTPLKQVMGTFLAKTGMSMPRKRNDLGFWWSEIREVLHIANDDIKTAQALVDSTVDTMRQEKLSIVSPRSIVGTARRLTGEQNGNQNGVVASY